MKCNSCGKTLNDEMIAFCEKCEKHYCMDCYTKHRNHKLIFKRLENDILTRINTGITGAGINDTHHKHYTDEQTVLRRRCCEHVKEDMELGKVIFRCEDGKVRCAECFYKSKINNADPIMKTDENKLMLLLTHTYEPQNLEFEFNCDDEGTKGEEITLNLAITNNKLHDIEDININIEAFAAEPLPENTSLNMYREQMYSKYLLFKKFHFDEIKSKEPFKIELEVKIPKDGEIEKNQFTDFYEGMENEYEKNETLTVPDKLMIYAHFTYKTCSGFRYWSYVESDVVNLK